MPEQHTHTHTQNRYKETAIWSNISCNWKWATSIFNIEVFFVLCTLWPHNKVKRMKRKTQVLATFDWSNRLRFISNMSMTRWTKQEQQTAAAILIIIIFYLWVPSCSWHRPKCFQSVFLVCATAVGALRSNASHISVSGLSICIVFFSSLWLIGRFGICELTHHMWWQ